VSILGGCGVWERRVNMEGLVVQIADSNFWVVGMGLIPAVLCT